MVKIWKRSLSMLLAVMMIFSMMPMQAIAAELEEIGTDDTSIVEPETPDEEPEVPEEEPEEPEEPEHTCEFSAVVTDPTCTEGGYTTYTCECGEVYTADEVEALGHSFEEGTCTACGAADPDYEKPEEEPTEEPTDAPEEPEHTCEFTSVVTDPTCTEGGYTTYTCTCGEVYTADEVEALGHAFEEGICTVCGEEDPDYQEELSGETRIIYFHNAEGWEEVYAAWSFDEEDFEDVEFPGEKMKDETELEDVWFVELPVEADDVLFSDGIEVTEELLAAEKEAGLEVIHEIAAELETKLSKDLYQNEEWTNYEDEVDALEAAKAAEEAAKKAAEEAAKQTKPPVMDKAPETTTDPVQELIDSLPASVNSQEEYDAVYAIVTEIEENGYDLTAEQMDAVFAAMNAADEWFGAEEAGDYDEDGTSTAALISNTDPAWRADTFVIEVHNDASSVTKSELYSLLVGKYGEPETNALNKGGMKYGNVTLGGWHQLDTSSAELAENISYAVEKCTNIKRNVSWSGITYTETWEKQTPFTVEVYDILTVNTTINGATTTDQYKVFRGKTHSGTVAPKTGYDVTVTGATTYDAATGAFTVSGLSADAEVNITYTPKNYTATWKVGEGTWADGTTADKTSTVAYGAVINAIEDEPKREGYSFIGWDDLEDGETMPAENVSFTAKYDAKPVKRIVLINKDVEVKTFNVYYEDGETVAVDGMTVKHLNEKGEELGSYAVTDDLTNNEKFISWVVSEDGLTYTADWDPDTNNNDVADSAETITVNFANATVKVDGKDANNGVAALYDSTKGATITVTPADGYYVEADRDGTYSRRVLTISIPATEGENRHHTVTVEAKQPESLVLPATAEIKVNGYGLEKLDGVQAKVLEKLIGAGYNADHYKAQYKSWLLGWTRPEIGFTMSIGDTELFRVVYNPDSNKYPDAISNEVTITISDSRDYAEIGTTYVNGSKFDTVDQFKAAFEDSLTANGEDFNVGTLTGKFEWNETNDSVKVTLYSAEGWLETTKTFDGLTWVVNQYPVTFYAEDGKTVLLEKEYDYGTPAEKIEKPLIPSKEGYTPVEWKVEDVKGKATYTADYTINEYDVIFKNGDTVVSNQKVKYGAVIEAPAAPAKEGHTFNGWTGFTEGMTVPANDVTFTADWSVNSYKVTWKWVDEKGEPQELEKEYVYNTSISIPSEIPTEFVIDENTTKTIAGWEGFTANMKMPANNDLVFNATYTTEKTYKATFLSNGETYDVQVIIPTDENADNDNVTKPADPTLTGYRFDGWFTDAEFTAAFTAWDQAITEDITLYAKWVKQVTVTFEGAEVEAQTFDIYGTATMPADPDKKYAIFGGWLLDGAAYDFTTPVTEDIKLTANWIADVNDNNVLDENETITITVTKAITEGEKVDDVVINGVIPVEGTDNYIFDTNNPTVTITATPVVTDGISTTYVKSITGAELVYGDGFVATATVEVQNGNVIEVVFEAVPVLKKTPDVVEYNFFTREIPYADIYASVVEAPALVGENTTYTYFARPEMKHTVTIDSLDLDASIKTILDTVGIKDFSFDMPELWLELDAEIEESVSLETAVSTYLTKERLGGLLDKFNDAYEAAYDAYIAENGEGFLGANKVIAAAAGAKAGAEAVTADITDIYNTVYASAMYYGAHEFGYNADGSETVSEQIKIEYNDQSMHWTADATVVLKDSREVSYITGSDLTLTYRDYLDEDILANFTLTDKDGNPIEGEIYAMELTDPYTFEGKNVSETAYELTVKFAGNESYRRAEKNVTVTVVKAGLSIDLPNLNITHGDDYDLYANVSTANKYGDKQEVIDSLVEIIIGLDVANLDVSEDGKVTGADAHVQIMLPKDDTLELLFKTLGLDIYSDKGEVIDFAQLQDILGKLDGALGEFDSGNETVDGIVNVLESVTGLVDLSALKITFGGTYPTDVGVYLYGAVSTSANYETAYDVAYMLIKPQTTEYTLDWNDPALTNAVVTLPMFNDMDKGAHVVEEGAKNLKASYVILGVNTDTSDVLSTEIYENVRGNVWLSPDEIKENGAYLQIAYGIDWGNEFDYAMPIVRAFAVVPALYDVQLVGATGTPNDELLKEFNNEPQGFSVIVKNDNDKIIFSDHYQNVTALKDNAQLIVNYTGVQTNGKSVNLTTILNKDNKNEPIAKPVHAGVYAVTAFYMELNGDVELDVENLNVEDLYKLFDLADAGMDAGLLVIEPAESTVDVEEKIVNYNSETDILFKNMVKAGSAVEGLKPDTTIISAGIDTDAAFSESGWDAVRGIVNVDFPAWIDELLAEYAPGVKAGMSVAELKDVLLNKLPDISDKLIELGATEEMVNSLANLTGNVASVLAELPDNIRVSFIDDAKANEIGAYIVTAVVTDSDHYPSVDSGYLIVLPDVDMFELKWNYEDGNGIFTRDLLQHVDLLAKAYDAKSGAYNEDATGKISYMFVGIDSNGEFKHYTDPATLPNGAYIQMAYIELDIEGEMVISDMIARPIVVIASNCNVNVENVETVFDNAPHGVNVTVTDLEGNPIEGGEFTILYAGLQTNGKAYLDTAAPVHAGVYEALVTYTKTVDGELRYYGANVGYVLIDLAESEITVTGDTVTYDGKGHTAQVEITKGHPNADYTLISGGAYVSGDINKVGLEALHGNVNIDLPRWLDEALAEYEFTDGVNAAKLADYIQAYRDELVAAVKDTKLVDWNLVTEEQVNAAVEKLNAYIDELVAVLKKLPTDVALTFESDITYTEPGYYFYYGIVTDSDHYPSTADADWKILPAEITSVEVVGEYTYNGAEQTATLVVKAGELVLTAADYDVTGNTATNAGEYTVTVTGKGNFAGTASDAWTIAPAKITSAEVTSTHTYNGTEQTATLVVKAGDLVLTADDYTVTGNTGMKEGAYKATVTGTGNYTGTADADWKILPAMITSVEVVGEYTYNGAEQTVKLLVKAGDMIVNAGDYKVTGNTATDAGENTVTVSGIGSFAGVMDAKWTIAPAKITSVEVVGEYTYNGTEQTATLVVKAGDLVLTADDYTVTGNTGMKEGAYKATVTGTGNYTGTADADWKILPAMITSVEVVGEYTYNGAEQTVELLVKAGDMIVNAGDYKVTGNTATDAGENTVTVSGIGSFAGVMDAKWTIAPANIASVEIVIDPTTTDVYTDAKDVTITIAAKDDNGNVVDDEALVDGSYTITDAEGKHVADLKTALQTAGEYTVTPVVKENKNYVVEKDVIKSAKLTVEKKEIAITVADIITSTDAAIPVITPVIKDADGNDVTNAEVTITITNADGKEVTITEAAKTKGVYTITATVGNNNYVVNETDSDLEAILTVKHYVAQVGETKYETVQEAVDVAENGGTVQLLDNAGLALVQKALTIVRNGHSATVAALEGYTVERIGETHYVVKPISEIEGNTGAALAYVDLNDNTTFDGDEKLQSINDALQSADIDYNGVHAVRLTGNIEGENAEVSVLIPGGVTLDIQSYTLETRYLTGLTGSTLTGTLDNASGAGGTLKIPANNLALPFNVIPYEYYGYDMMPIYDEPNNRYTFGILNIVDNGYSHGLTMSGDTLTFRFACNTTPYIRTQYVGDGMTNNKLALIARLEWDVPGKGTAHQDFVYKDEFVETVLNTSNMDFVLTVEGYENLGITDESNLRVYGVIAGDSGIETIGTKFPKTN